MSEATGRALPNARVRRLMQAIQDVMGHSGLVTVLRQAGLQRFAGSLPPNDDQPGLRASEYAALLQAIENYYGRGARGTLMRIGYASFKRLVSRRLAAALLRAGLRLLSPAGRRKWVLRWLARELARPGGRASVHEDDGRLILLDPESDATAGRQRANEICWVTLGEIQEALKWATGQEYDVSETSCRAKGDPACRFEVGSALG